MQLTFTATVVAADGSKPTGILTVTRNGVPLTTAALTAAHNGTVKRPLPNPSVPGTYLHVVTFTGEGYESSSRSQTVGYF
ncbi:Ig-like domain repeat protein [Melittangium boletus]|uniref:Uncharacterized protein n=1 Tax=Melittangium boletus DSM 14713 TaxID=1294270 RepID=A0A250IH38_9BACT|nr:Ig-like domain repeat protein [Melittangium boletus]ATB30540.1 hypothetical protein MEBOL_004001 [Melittangium boletus DSM 14713]